MPDKQKASNFFENFCGKMSLTLDILLRAKIEQLNFNRETQIYDLRATSCARRQRVKDFTLSQTNDTPILIKKNNY